MHAPRHSPPKTEARELGSSLIRTGKHACGLVRPHTRVLKRAGVHTVPRVKL